LHADEIFVRRMGGNCEDREEVRPDIPIFLSSEIQEMIYFTVVLSGFSIKKTVCQSFLLAFPLEMTQ